MRVLFWSYSFWPAIGGLEWISAKLVLALRARGYEFAVVTSQWNPEQPAEAWYRGIPIYRFPFRDVNSYTNIDQLAAVRQEVGKLKRTFAPKLVHMNYAVDVSNFFHLSTVGSYPAPVLVTFHGRWDSHSSLDQRILHTADWVACVSIATLEDGRQLVPEISSRSSIIYNGLSSPAHPPCPLPIRAPRLLCLGRLSPEKGFDIALEAFASILKRFPHARLVIAGDGSTRAELERKAAELRIRENIDFIGWVAPDAVGALIDTATLVMMPSRIEGLPLVALEAALRARPVVATRVGGLPEVIVHEQTGLLVEAEDRSALAEAVAYLLTHPSAAARMGQAARNRVQKNFSWERQVDAYDALYQRLIK